MQLFLPLLVGLCLSITYDAELNTLLLSQQGQLFLALYIHHFCVLVYSGQECQVPVPSDTAIIIIWQPG